MTATDLAVICAYTAFVFGIGFIRGWCAHRAEVNR